MPPLRKSRAPFNRSSTTPFASPTGTPSDSASGAKRQSLMTEWTEPIPQALAPSFEEHGFARHGVLETMAPLGVPPSAKMKQRTRAMGETAARNSAFGKGAAAFGDDVGSTPEVTPAPELEPDDSERQEDELPADFVLHEEEEDDDYEPIKSKKKAKVAKTPVRGKTPVPGKTPVLGKTPVRNGNSKAASVSASPAVQPVQSPAPPETVAAQRLQSAVNDAMLHAIKEDNRQVGNALQEMWEDSKNDQTLAAVIGAVMQQDMTNEQWSTFRAYVKQSRKRQRKEAKRLQEGAAGRRAGKMYRESNSSQRPSPRASSELLPDDSASAVHDLAYQDASAPSVSRRNHATTDDAHMALQTSIENMSASASLHPFSAAPAMPATDTSGESTPRMLSKSPRKRPTGSAMPTNGGFSNAAPASAGNLPDAGGGSDSELSDVNEEIVQKGPPEPALANGKALSVAAAAAKKAKSAAFARAAKKSKPNTGKPVGKHIYKPQPQTAEQIAEDERTYERRNEMAKQQPIQRFNLNDFPTSDVRDDHDYDDTESLTESQIAVGPPVNSNQLRLAGRVPHQGTKRIREDASGFSSPQLQSSRPSTPAVISAPKRIKLTHGKAARTKTS